MEYSKILIMYAWTFWLGSELVAFLCGPGSESICAVLIGVLQGFLHW